MAEENTSKKCHWSLKPVLILAVAAIFISKAQRVASEDSIVLTTETSTHDSPVCPDYCSLNPDPATRRKAPFKMWYYDPTEGGCKRFRWSGRGGNKNRFYKRADCEETCSKCTITELSESQRAERKDCSLPSDEGRCAEEGKGQAQLVWHHDKTTTNCSPFIFYGCGGNGNRFASKNECEDTCH